MKNEHIKKSPTEAWNRVVGRARFHYGMVGVQIINAMEAEAATPRRQLEIVEALKEQSAHIHRIAFELERELPAAQRLEAAARRRESTARTLAGGAERNFLDDRDRRYLLGEAEKEATAASELRTRARQLGGLRLVWNADR